MRGNVQKISLWVKTYLDVTKPGIIMGNAVTAMAGFVIASKSGFDLFLFIQMSIGLSLIIASGCVLNNYIDRNADIQMVRTRNRPLVKKLISPGQALTYAVVLLGLGTTILALYTNWVATGLTLFGFVAYVFVYSYVKYWTVHATFIGSFAGAVPPAVGYCAVRGEFDLGAALIALFVMAWQMPHFFAISIYRMKEYEKAGIPVYPLVRGMLATKVQMLLYLFAFTIVGSLLTLMGYTSSLFLYTLLALSGYWLYLCLKGFTTKVEVKWARQMFFYSLLVITVLSFLTII